MPMDLPQAVNVHAQPTVAAVFEGGSETSDHSCTASVVSSTSGDLLITAAHCVSGQGTDITVAPGYDAGSTPYGVWSVTAVFVDRAWEVEQSASDDVAILRVAPTVANGLTRTLQDVTSADPLGTTPGRSTPVTVQGFNAGTDDQAISCMAGLNTTAGNPTFQCGNYRDGSSGSPWFATGSDGVTRVIGVIGGLDQGGCTNQTSYSPVFGAAVHNLLSRAEQAGDDGDTLPSPVPPAACGDIAMN